MAKIPFTALTILLLICTALSAQGQQNATNKVSETKKEVKNDSTKTKAGHDSIKLGEVVVTADNIRFENGKVVMTPTKQEKNLSKDIESLIENMNTGILKVENGEIKASNGQSVTLFINGEPVNKFDESTFWAKNVLSVEYMPGSNDPKYLGSNQIVNLVMKEYVAGGLTKLNGYQNFPNLGQYTAASKLVVKKMTYNALFKGEYSRDHRSNEKRTESYKDVWYDGVKYDDITRTEESSNTQRNDKLSAGLNARYNDEKLTASHTFSFNWQREPETVNYGSLIYKPEIIPGNRMGRSNYSKNYSYNLDGMYRYRISPTLFITTRWGLNYTKNNSLSSFFETGANQIINDVSEDVWNANMLLFLSKRLSQKVNINLAASEKITNYNTLYSGTELSNQKQTVSNTNIFAYLYYEPTESVILTLMPQLTIYSRNINHNYKKTDFMPGIDFQSYYTINPKSAVSLNVVYRLINPGSSQTNDLILRQTELKWIEGSPSIKPSDFYGLSAAYNIIPVKWYNLSLHAGYLIKRNGTYLSYYSGGENYDGVIGRYINGINNNQYSFNCDMTFKPFNGKLNLTTQLQYVHYRFKNGTTNNSFHPRFNAKFFAGDWSISAGLNGSQKLVNDGGLLIEKRPWNYYMQLDYGNGNINVNIGLYSIFTKRRYEYTYLNNGPYSYNSRKLENFYSQNVSLSLTYTFDYGKKVDQRIDINSSSEKTTSILSTY